MEQKTCTRCNTPKSLVDDFHKNKRSKDGRARWCKVCALEYTHDYRQSNQDRVQSWSKGTNEDKQRRKVAHVAEVRAWLDDIKASTPCSDCGNQYPAVCMDFDHVGDDKKKDVARMVGDGYSKSAILEEIEKCELVCANCHRIRTHASGRARPWDERKRVYDRASWR